AVPPVLRADLVGPEGVLLPGAEAAQLLVPGDVQPELADHHPEGRLVRLELVDLAVGPPPFLLGAETLHALHEDAPVVGAVEDAEVAGAREHAPEAPQVVMG